MNWLTRYVRLPTRVPRGALWALVLGWVVLVAGGFSFLETYEATPGAQEAAPRVWPAGSRIRPGEGRYTLVMFLHPHCPCSRASLQELAEVMARCPVRPDAHVLCYRPAGAGPEWGRDSLGDRAAAIPGVRVWWDEDAAEGRRFGAVTSGHVVLYGPAGERLFSGGITGARGHAGDNAGRRAVAALLGGGDVGPGASHVFGCPIGGPTPPDGKGAEGCKCSR